MQVRLDQIGDEPYTWNESRAISVESLERPELLTLGPVAWRGRIVRVVSDFLLSATLNYEQTSACSRCLGPAVEKVDDSLELLIQVDKEPAEPDEGDRDEPEIELSEDDMGVLHLRGHELDLEPLLREQMQLDIPMRPLCKKSCRGLCSRCGADLNLGACECRQAEVDPRWAALAALKSTLPGGKAEP